MGGNCLAFLENVGYVVGLSVLVAENQKGAHVSSSRFCSEQLPCFAGNSDRRNFLVLQKFCSGNHFLPNSVRTLVACLHNARNTERKFVRGSRKD